jgi:glycosyltransferase involved in cell wall biosynthesis
MTATPACCVPARRMRVAVIINTYEARAESGGFIHLFEAAKRWTDFDLTVFGPEEARPRVAKELAGAEFLPIPSCERRIGNRAVVYAFRTLAAALLLPGRLRRFDAIYVLSQSLPDIVPAVLAAPQRTVAQVFHLQPLPWKRPGSLLNNMFAFLSERLGVALVRRFVRNVVVLTPLILPALKLPERTSVTHAGSGAWSISVDGMALAPQDRSGAVYVGRMHPAKGLDDVIEAWSMVREQSPHAVLTLVGLGDEEYVRKLRDKVERRGLDGSVRFAGFVSEAEKARILGGARMFVSASREEGWGIAIAEAMALGVPCVTYDLPVFNEVFSRGRIGAPIGDVAALARAMTTLLNDDALHERLLRQAADLAKAFSWDAVARAEERAIRRAAE